MNLSLLTTLRLQRPHASTLPCLAASISSTLLTDRLIGLVAVVLVDDKEVGSMRCSSPLAERPEEVWIRLRLRLSDGSTAVFMPRLPTFDLYSAPWSPDHPMGMLARSRFRAAGPCKGGPRDPDQICTAKVGAKDGSGWMFVTRTGMGEEDVDGSARITC